MAFCVESTDDSLSTVVLACLGFLSPANRGALMTCSVVLWVLLGTPAGYVSARLYKSKFPYCSFFNKGGLFEIFRSSLLPARKPEAFLTWRKLINAQTRWNKICL